jgi:hypothetical protein
MMTKQTYRSNNFFSDSVTITVKRRLDDGTYLVHEHTDCVSAYQSINPDRYRVMSEADLVEFESTTQPGNHGSGKRVSE